MVIAGIDYSMVSPAICVHKGDEWSFKNCKFLYLASKSKLLIENACLNGVLYPEWNTPEERFSFLAAISINFLIENKVDFVSLEGYAYSGSGLVFQIGENTGTLKQKMYTEQIPFEVTPPTVIKKYATGKGNANKEKMWDSFFDETKFNIFNILGQEERKHWSPVSDIVDSYYLAKYGFHNLVDN